MPPKRKAAPAPSASDSPPAKSTRSSKRTAAKQSPKGKSPESRPDREGISESQGQEMNAGGMDDTGSSPCQLISPKIDFLSPWKEQGHIEVVAGIEGPGSGSIRLCRGDDDIPALSSVTLVPFKDIEQVIITYKSIEMFQVIMVPKAASGASSLTREEPQIIQFKWPDRKANDQLKGQAGEKADRESDTYSSVLKSVFDEQLAAFDKEVVVYTEQTQLEADPSIFATEAHLGPVTLSSMKGKLKK